MPKLSDRERLAKIEADQRSLAQEAETVRRTVRAHYGGLVADLAVEGLSEREFREVVTHAIRLGGPTATATLKAAAGGDHPSKTSPERRPSDEHGGAARRRPTPPSGVASASDGPGPLGSGS